MQKLPKIFITVFMLALVLPYPLYWALHSVVDGNNYENRALATWADVASKPLREKPKAVEDMLGDHAAFRNELMALNAGINLKLFGTVQSENVLLGKEGWLFYKNVSDSRSLDDYQGINLYAPEQLAQLSELLVQLQQNLAAKGTQLVLLLAPNKEHVYAQYMPSSIPRVAQPTKAEALVQHLSDTTSIPVVYPLQALIQQSKTQQVYYKYDTHWNDIGALTAAQLLQQALGAKGTLAEFTTVPSKKQPLQDLAFSSATQRFLPQDIAYDALPPQSGAQPSEKTLLMLQDSFGEGMQEIIATQYADSSFVHFNRLDTLSFENAPDVFVFQVAERYTDRLWQALPTLVKMSR